jgi:hypothetical protein
VKPSTSICSAVNCKTSAQPNPHRRTFVERDRGSATRSSRTVGDRSDRCLSPGGESPAFSTIEKALKQAHELGKAEILNEHAAERAIEQSLEASYEEE